jgi:Ni2+-binding GTPase involved in maturation of urease and hydrogenase
MSYPRVSSAERPLLVAVGGFLGAGKTTTLLRTADRLRHRGQRVAIVTNDQASDLVDTAHARAALARVEAVVEVSGGCFCCRFDRLQDVLQDVIERTRPDVILAEAVGSCTDLAATVYQPLRQLPGMPPVRLGPLTAVVDGSDLRGTGQLDRPSPRRSPVAYLRDRQLAEADLILLNKTDLLSPDEIAAVTSALLRAYPGAPILPISAATGAGIPRWLDHLAAFPAAGSRVVDVDYDTYAQAEASLGWLNLEGALSTAGAQPLAGTLWIESFIGALRDSVEADGAEIAHVKLWLESDTGSAGGSLAGDGVPRAWTRGTLGHRVRLLVNARIAAWPDALRQWIEDSIAQAGRATGATFKCQSLAAFSPPRPIPHYRLQPPVSEPQDRAG